MTLFCYLDIETLPTQSDDTRAKIAATITPPGSMTKADTIAAWEKEKKPAAVEEAIAKTSFNGAHGHVCCIGWAFDDEPASSIIWPLDVDSEAATLHTFKAIIESRTNFPPVIVGHNVAEFDIRFLWQRAMVLGIKMPTWFPRSPRPWDREVFDTMTAFAGARNTVSMDTLCQALGIPGKDDMDGSMVAEAWANGEYQRIADYCKADVERTRAIHRKMMVALGEVA